MYLRCFRFWYLIDFEEKNGTETQCPRYTMRKNIKHKTIVVPTMLGTVGRHRRATMGVAFCFVGNLFWVTEGPLTQRRRHFVPVLQYVLVVCLRNGMVHRVMYPVLFSLSKSMFGWGVELFKSGTTYQNTVHLHRSTRCHYITYQPSLAKRVSSACWIHN